VAGLDLVAHESPIVWVVRIAVLVSYARPVRHLHLTHPKLDFWVTVEIHERDGRYMATADLGEDSRDVGVGDTPQEAVKEALRSLGEPYAREMAEGVEDQRRGGQP
jgi:hypothetical protein